MQKDLLSFKDLVLGLDAEVQKSFQVQVRTEFGAGGRVAWVDTYNDVGGAGGAAIECREDVLGLNVVFIVTRTPFGDEPDETFQTIPELMARLKTIFKERLR